jgi:hypothetical protein
MRTNCIAKADARQRLFDFESYISVSVTDYLHSFAQPLKWYIMDYNNTTITIIIIIHQIRSTLL